MEICRGLCLVIVVMAVLRSFPSPLRAYADYITRKCASSGYDRAGDGVSLKRAYLGALLMASQLERGIVTRYLYAWLHRGIPITKNEIG